MNISNKGGGDNMVYIAYLYIAFIASYGLYKAILAILNIFKK